MGSLKFIIDDRLAKQEVVEDESTEYIEFSIGEHEFKARKPTSDEVIALTLMGGDDDERLPIRIMMQSVFDFMGAILPEEQIATLRRLYARGVISRHLLIGGDDKNEEGIVNAIVRIASEGNPTPPSQDSSESPKPTGKRSTGRAPGKGSTLSTSASTAS